MLKDTPKSFLEMFNEYAKDVYDALGVTVSMASDRSSAAAST
jgi:hypothetical protein